LNIERPPLVLQSMGKVCKLRVIRGCQSIHTYCVPCCAICGFEDLPILVVMGVFFMPIFEKCAILLIKTLDNILICTKIHTNLSMTFKYGHFEIEILDLHMLSST